MQAKPFTQKLAALTAIVLLLSTSVPTSSASMEVAKVIQFFIKLALTILIDEKIKIKQKEKYEKKKESYRKKPQRRIPEVLDTSRLKSPLAKILMVSYILSVILLKFLIQTEINKLKITFEQIHSFLLYPSKSLNSFPRIFYLFF